MFYIGEEPITRESFNENNFHKDYLDFFLKILSLTSFSLLFPINYDSHKAH